MQNLSSKTKNRETLFEEMYISYLHKVQFFAYSYLHDFEKAKCLAQEVFISVLENVDGIDFERDPLPYLLTLTKNRCLNIIRKHNVEKRFQDFSKNNYDAESLNYLSLIDSSSTNLYSKDVEDILRGSMNKMPESIRLTFYLNRFKDMKYREIAKMQGVSVKTIEYRIMVALKILRIKFKDYLPLGLGYLFLIL